MCLESLPVKYFLSFFFRKIFTIFCFSKNFYEILFDFILNKNSNEPLEK